MKKYPILLIILLCIATLGACVLPQRGIEVEEDMGITDFNFKHTGIMRDDNYVYGIQKEKGGANVHIEYGTGFLYSDEKVKKSFLREVAAVVKKYNVLDWDGFDAGHEDSDESEGFSLSIGLSDGSCVTARGKNRFPEHYEPFTEALDVLFKPFVDRAFAKKSSKAEMPGGRDDHYVSNAPLVIQSKDIKAFECEYYRPNFSNRYHNCFFKLERFDDKAVVSIQTYWNQQRVADVTFDAPLSSLDRLHAVIDEHELAKKNGIYNHTNGLPPGLGIEFDAEYMSGEKISFRDNSDSLLSTLADIDLHDLFFDLAAAEGHYLYKYDSWLSYQLTDKIDLRVLDSDGERRTDIGYVVVCGAYRGEKNHIEYEVDVSDENVVLLSQLDNLPDNYQDDGRYVTYDHLVGLFGKSPGTADIVIRQRFGERLKQVAAFTLLVDEDLEVTRIH